MTVLHLHTLVPSVTSISCWRIACSHMASLQVKCLTRTAARSQIAEQRLMEMKLLHQSIEQQHKQLCMTVALLKNALASEPVARQHEG